MAYNCTLDLKVKVLYGDDQHSILSQYVKFTQIYKKNSREIGKNREAILATLKECREKDILKDYIEKHESEVIGIIVGGIPQSKSLQAHTSRRTGISFSPVVGSV